MAVALAIKPNIAAACHVNSRVLLGFQKHCLPLPLPCKLIRFVRFPKTLPSKDTVWTANLDRRIETPHALGHYLLHISLLQHFFSVAITIIVSCGPNCVGTVTVNQLKVASFPKASSAHLHKGQQNYRAPLTQLVSVLTYC